MTDRWRYACPECGSRCVMQKSTNGLYRCKSCYATDFEPVDLKREEILA